MKIEHKESIPTQKIASGIASTVVVLGLGMMLLKSSLNAPKLTEQTAPDVIIELLDSSESNREALPAQLEQVAALNQVLDPSKTFLIVDRFDNATQELFCDGIPASDEEFLTNLTPKLAPLSKKDNTYLDKAFADTVNRTKSCKGRIAMVVATDGFCEGMTKGQHLALASSARELAKNRQFIGAYFIGVNPANKAVIRADLAALDDGRLFFPETALAETGIIKSLLVKGEDHG